MFSGVFFFYILNFFIFPTLAKLEEDAFSRRCFMLSSAEVLRFRLVWKISVSFPPPLSLTTCPPSFKRLMCPFELLLLFFVFFFQFFFLRSFKNPDLDPRVWIPLAPYLWGISCLIACNEWWSS